jgi:protein-S-isoprenylcysteine O-methyltransferase Ste14
MTRSGAAVGTIVFFFVAPGVVAGAIPWGITGWRLPDPLPLSGVLVVLGVLLLIPALWVLIDSFVRFALSLGTPAPIAPTKRLVVDGWYRFVRNPMYVAVVSIILSQALLFASWPALAYGLAVFLLVHLFVVGYEEPALRAQFPADYANYTAHVRRWVPRLTPWRGEQI